MTSNISTKLAITLGVLLSTMTTTGFAAANPLRGNPFINSSTYLQSEHDDGDDNDQDQGQDCDKDDDKDDDKDKGDNRSNHDGGDQDKDDDKDQDNKCVKAPTMRVDCRYHNDKDDDKVKESQVRFCYASAVYTPEADEDDGELEYKNLQLGVGCDKQTIYNNSARVHTETVSERISPPTAAFPAVEIFPQGALLKTGTYESVLDIRAGRLAGVCYVHEIEDED